MSAEVAFRQYQASDEAPVLNLLRLTLGKGRAFERSAAFFRWKHLENPFGRSLMLLANGQEILGLRTFLRWQFRAGGNVVPAVRAVDTATHPGYQRMGIFSRLTTASLEQAKAEGMGFVFNTPNQYSLPGYLKLGWTFVGKTTVFVRPLRLLRIALALAARRPDEATDEGPSDDVTALDHLLAREAALSALLARDDAQLASGIRTARTVPYLRWRYRNAPSLRYSARVIGNGALAAAAIFRRTLRRGLVELSIAELLFDDPGQGRRVVREILTSAPADYAVAHCAWEAPHRRVLMGIGFVPVPRLGPNFTVRPLESDFLGYDPTSPGSWRLSLGDLEVF